jgi:hypothetical protein
MRQMTLILGPALKSSRVGEVGSVCPASDAGYFAAIGEGALALCADDSVEGDRAEWEFAPDDLVL